MQRDLLLLREIIDATEQAQSLVAGRSVSDIDADRLRRDALLWNVTVLGEAVSLVPEKARSRFPVTPRRNPTRLRNSVVDGYWSVDITVLHTTTTEQLGELVRMLRDATAALETAA